VDDVVGGVRGGNVARMGKQRISYNVFTGESERCKPLKKN
jgi:hypothetical protein